MNTVMQLDGRMAILEMDRFERRRRAAALVHEARMQEAAKARAAAIKPRAEKRAKFQPYDSGLTISG